MNRVKIFFPKYLYDPGFRAHIFPLLKPFFKNEEYTDEERLDLYGITSQDIAFVDDPMLAEILILPMSWNYYVFTEKKQFALEFIDQYSHLKQKIFIYNAGDIGYKIPYFPNTNVFRLAINRLPKEDNVFIIPPFIQDPLRAFFNSSSIYLRSYSDKPLVGFCGFAKTSKVDATLELLKIGLQNVLSLLNLRKEESQQFLSSSYFRGRILKILKKSSSIETNFITRKKYRAGAQLGNISHSTVLEFYNNMNDSDYVLCARGSGNFSVRFYETLAMGRIPVYVNIQGALPLDTQIKWRDHVVWIEREEVNIIDEKIKAFHDLLDQQTFQKLQEANRKLWRRNLTMKGFFKQVTQ